MLYLNTDIQSLSEADVERLIAELPAWRREPTLRIGSPELRRESVLAFHELQRGLREELGFSEVPPFSYNEHGKPLLAGYPDIWFSLSHCRSAVGCLIDSRPCGLDIERMRPVRESLVRYTMNELEQAEIARAADTATAFLTLWTRKEALLGTGISGGLRDALSPEQTEGIRLTTQLHAERGFVLSQAVEIH